MSNNKNTFKKVTLSAVASAALLCSGALMNNSHVDAATNTSHVSGVLTAKYNGKGKIRLLDANGRYQNQYVSKNTKWKVFEKGIINGHVMYRIGSQKQWIPASYTNWDASTEAKTSTNTSASHSKATNRKSISGVAVVVYGGAGKVRLLNSNGQYQNQYINKGTQWKVFESATINGQTMFRLGSDSQWVPSIYVKVAPAGTSSSVSYTHQTTKPSNNKPATKPNTGNQTKPNQGQTTKPSTKPNHGGSTSTTTPSAQGNWSQAQIQEAQTAFINYVNAWRQKEGLKPFANDVSWLQQGVETRANDNASMFQSNGTISHTRPNGSDWDTAFNVQSGALGGENIGYVGSSSGYTPEEAARSIAASFINEGPQGGHYAVLHAEYGNHPAIGVAFRCVQRNGQYVYIMNMETGTSDRLAPSSEIIQTSNTPWAAKWAGKVAPNLYDFVHNIGGKLIINVNELPDNTGYAQDGKLNNGISNSELKEYEEAFINYYASKYGAQINR